MVAPCPSLFLHSSSYTSSTAAEKKSNEREHRFVGKGYKDLLLPQYIVLAKVFQYTVDPGYSDIQRYPTTICNEGKFAT